MHIVYDSPWGDSWSLGDEHKGVFIVEDGLNSLTGDVEDVTTAPVGFPGQFYDGLNVKPMAGTLQFWVMGWEGDSLAEVSSRFRSGWHNNKAGTLTIDSYSYGRLFTQVRRAGNMPALPKDLADLDGYNLQFSVIADSGAWWTHPLTGGGRVEVTNPGDVIVWPKIRWQGAGGAVVLPSSAAFKLPPTGEALTLSLSNAESCAVTREDGTVHMDMWRQLRSVVMPEGIPPQESRTYSLPNGATLTWSIGVFDPWK